VCAGDVIERYGQAVRPAALLADQASRQHVHLGDYIGHLCVYLGGLWGAAGTRVLPGEGLQTDVVRRVERDLRQSGPIVSFLFRSQRQVT